MVNMPINRSFQDHWKEIQKFCPLENVKKPTPSLLFQKAAGLIVQIPHETREEILNSPVVERFAQLSPALSQTRILKLCGVDPAEFKKAQSQLNRYRGHIGGSSLLSLQALQAVFLYSFLLWKTSENSRDEKWVEDMIDLAEPLLKSLVKEMRSIQRHD
jgi:hypothetical protein